ncbi:MULTISPECIES: DUF1853 family protein [unclassified Photobacterium]|uniref:DUF1853 family protein n=1 Tax=unclassified Photobacterium TaxID=2628852 RepID=UPI001EDD13C6|nr:MULTISPECIES: DUF1853 family protein [unclassified Photobacterium]MCG3864636.1 DUF1853 family protein [Photobacterium sp. Ph6]MCG3876087.1 DUF1853 family protein [Photobacterium sp. Ph5]
MLQKEKDKQLTKDYLAVLNMPNLISSYDYVCNDTWLEMFKRHAQLPPIESYIGNHRLGFYYQWLWQQWIVHHPDYELLEEEVQLHWNQKTVGSIDFLVKNLLSNEIEHWEVAIKFYLAFENHWPGPNAKDNLDKKTARMIDHQLTLSEHDAFNAKFDEQPTQRRLIMQGRLFHAWPDPQQGSTININPNANTGLWCYQSDAVHLVLKALTKKQWIAPPAFAELDEYLDPDQITVPTQAVDRKDRVWFIVPNHWPKHNSELIA